MEIQGPQLPSTLTLAKSDFALQKLQPGQEIIAKVIELNPSKKEVILQIGRQLIRTNSDVSVSVGQTLKAVVQKTANEIVLTIKPPSKAADIITPALKQLLPKQLPIQQFHVPLKQLQATLSNISNTGKQAASTQTPTPENKLPLQSSNHAALSSSIKTVLSQISRSVPSIQQFSTPTGVKTSLQNSGNFFEAKLQQSITPKTALPAITQDKPAAVQADLIIAGKRIPRKNIQALLETATNQATQQTTTNVTQVDGKANLIRLIALLKQWPTTQQAQTSSSSGRQQATNQTQNPASQVTPPPLSQTPISDAERQDSLIRDLLAKSEGALSKITLNQLASTPSDSTVTRQSWQFDIPFYNGQTTESVFIKIEQDASTKKKENSEKQWTVSLEMNPPKLGQIKNKLTLNGSQINSQFWSENPETSSLIRKNIHLFKSQLTKAQLQAENIQVHTGSGPDLQKPPITNAILSEKA